jgi:hypothetical protein
VPRLVLAVALLMMAMPAQGRRADGPLETIRGDRSAVAAARQRVFVSADGRSPQSAEIGSPPSTSKNVSPATANREEGPSVQQNGHGGVGDLLPLHGREGLARSLEVTLARRAAVVLDAAA